MKKEIKTRKNERVISTLNPKEMLNMFLKEDIMKKWTEDFIDDDTKEVVSIERCELLFRKGTLVDQDVQQGINFYIIEGTIEEPVVLSDTQRNAIYGNRMTYGPMHAKVTFGSKSHNVFLLAYGIDHAMDIIRDYFEQECNGVFFVTSIKFLDWMDFIDAKPRKLDLNEEYLNDNIDFDEYCNAKENGEGKEEDVSQRKYWQVDIMLDWETKKARFTDEDGSTFLVHAMTAEDAVEDILNRMTAEDHKKRDEATRKVDGEKVFTYRLTKVQQMPFYAHIPLQFSIDNDNRKAEEL